MILNKQKYNINKFQIRDNNKCNIICKHNKILDKILIISNKIICQIYFMDKIKINRHVNRSSLRMKMVRISLKK